MERKQIKVSDIINDINNGFTRNMIKEKYNLTGPDMKVIFSNPTLKGRKAKKVTIELIDDVNETEQEKPYEELNRTIINETEQEKENNIDLINDISLNI